MRRSGLVVPNERLTGLAADIVSAYVGNNSLRASDLPDLIANVYAALGSLRKPAETATPAPLKPAVPIRSSVTNEAIICLEDGKRFKTLKRHLRTAYGLSPEQYRAKWGLPFDYPMVAPAYAEARSAISKSLGFGRKPVKGPKSGKRPDRSAGSQR